jgi:hypothetical protein
VPLVITSSPTPNETIAIRRLQTKTTEREKITESEISPGVFQFPTSFYHGIRARVIKVNSAEAYIIEPIPFEKTPSRLLASITANARHSVNCDSNKK